MDEKDAVLAFSNFRCIGNTRLRLLTEYYGSLLAAWKAGRDEYIKIGLNISLVEGLESFKKVFNVDLFKTELSKKEIRYLTYLDKDYPSALLEISDYPPVLYLKGNLGDLRTAIGVVGTRKMTGYGAEVCERITSDLVVYGAVIVSGMARGIDTVAHRTALENDGKTIAVLGCGVDVIYPYQNRELYHKIIESGGAVVSEVPPGVGVTRGAFPLRNRIISGLSKGVVVIEGAIGSGSLITARYALDQGRDVFAVPGPITSRMSEGPTYLIEQGARIASSGRDVITELGLLKECRINNISEKTENDNQSAILNCLADESLTIDELSLKLGFDCARISALISILEVEGKVKRLGEKFVKS